MRRTASAAPPLVRPVNASVELGERHADHLGGGVETGGGAATDPCSTVASAPVATRTARYHGSGVHPRAARAFSTARFTGWPSSAAYDATSRAPRRRVTRAISRRPAAGSGRWLSENAATAASKAESRNGSAPTSPTAAGGRSAWCASIPSAASTDHLARAASEQRTGRRARAGPEVERPGAAHGAGAPATSTSANRS